MALFIDLHAHLEWISDLGKAVENAKKAGLKIIVASGLSKETNLQALEFSKRYDIVKCSFGLYPVDVLERDIGKKIENVDEEIDFIRKHEKEIIAIGEVGLDYKDNPDKPRQVEVFQKIISMAEELNKPVIVHSRRAEQDCMEILEKSNVRKVILHCFCGKKELIKKGIENEWYFTIPTNAVRSKQFIEMIKMVDISHLFCETDTPFLSPFADKKNEPAFVVESYKKIAEIKGMDLTEVENNIWANWQRVFL